MTDEELKAHFFGTGDNIGAGLPVGGGGGQNPVANVVGGIIKSTVDDFASLTALPAALAPSNGTLGFLDNSVEATELEKRKRAVATAAMYGATEGLGALAPVVKGAPAAVRAVLGAGFGGAAVRMGAGSLAYEELRKKEGENVNPLEAFAGGALTGALFHGVGQLLHGVVQKGEARAADSGLRGTRRLAEDLLARMAAEEQANVLGGVGTARAEQLLAKAKPEVRRFVSDTRLENDMGLGDTPRPSPGPPQPPQPFSTLPGQEEAAQVHGNQVIGSAQEQAYQEHMLRQMAEDQLSGEGGGGEGPFLGSEVAQMAHQILAERMTGLHSGDTSWLSDAMRRVSRQVSEPPKFAGDLLKGDYILPGRKALTQQLHAEANLNPVFAGVKGKDARLKFAGDVLGRPVSTFSDINELEHVNLINAMRSLRGEAPLVPARSSETLRGIQTRRGFVAARFPDPDHASIYDLPRRVRAELVPEDDLQRYAQAMGVPPDAVVEAAQMYREHVDAAARVNGAGRIQVPTFGDFMERLPQLAQRSRDEVLNSLTARANAAEAEAVGSGGRRSRAPKAPPQPGTAQDARRAGRARQETATAKANVAAGVPEAGVPNEPKKRGGARPKKQYTAAPGVAPIAAAPPVMKFMGEPLARVEPPAPPKPKRAPSAGGNKSARVKPFSIKDPAQMTRMVNVSLEAAKKAAKVLTGKTMNPGEKAKAYLQAVEAIRKKLEVDGDIGEARRQLGIIAENSVKSLSGKAELGPAEKKVAAQMQGRLANFVLSDRVEREVMPGKGTGTPKASREGEVVQEHVKLPWRPAPPEYAGQAAHAGNEGRSVTAVVDIGPITVRAHRGPNAIYYVEGGTVHPTKRPAVVEGKAIPDYAPQNPKQTPRILHRDVIQAAHLLVADLRANHSARGISVPPSLQPLFERLVTEGKLLEHKKGVFMMTAEAANFPELKKVSVKPPTAKEMRSAGLRGERADEKTIRAIMRGDVGAITSAKMEAAANKLMLRNGIDPSTGTERLNDLERQAYYAHQKAMTTGDWMPWRKAMKELTGAESAEDKALHAKELAEEAANGGPVLDLSRDMMDQPFEGYLEAPPTAPAPRHPAPKAEPIVGTVREDAPPVEIALTGQMPTSLAASQKPPVALGTYESFLGYLRKEKEPLISRQEYEELTKEPDPSGKPLSAFGIMKRIYEKRNFAGGGSAPEPPVMKPISGQDAYSARKAKVLAERQAKRAARKPKATDEPGFLSPESLAMLDQFTKGEK